MTNCEHIRTLTVEEMAEFLTGSDCPYCIGGQLSDCDNINCKQGTIEWLKQEHVEPPKMVDENKLVKDIADAKFCSTEYCKAYNGFMCDAEPAFNDCPEAIINYIKAMEGVKTDEAD